MTTKHEIGSVAKLTGLSIHNLRVWERRHNAVTPERSPDGRRLYSDRDIERLTLLKQCVENGDRISAIANLDDAALKIRTEKFERYYPAAISKTTKDDSMVRMGLAGMPLFRKSLQNFAVENNYKIRFCFGVSTIADIKEAYKLNVVDCVVTEVSNITDEIAAQLLATSTAINGAPIIVLHHFSRSEIRNQLELNNIWPINSLSSAATTLAIVLKKSARPSVPAEEPSNKHHDTPPEPTFSTLQLSIIQQIETSLPCECPRHISGIVRSLRAFEEYSANCESRNDEDVALHQNAKLETARARHIMEQLLITIIKADGIELSDILNNKVRI